ncbi:MAG TPA: DNA-processing protein DprA [Steroidobacteraceae bacterium]|nr:DNA-processing protein DprA [Steroidobacteraceae bacterium]
MDELRARALLGRAQGVGTATLRAALRQAGSAAQLLEHPGALPEPTRAYLAAPPSARIEADLEWLRASGARLLDYSCAAYPRSLALLPDAPAVLYVLGELEALGLPQIAMVGSRAPTAGAAASAREIAGELARSGLAVTSGLARGIDAASHQGALEGGGITLAVCAHGLDLTYPPEHAGLAVRIQRRGALVSELPPGSAPAGWRFHARNRLISGLSLATLVVEARRGSGSLATAAWARRQGRPVLAVPGSIRSSHASGCHELLRGGAVLIEGAPDVLRALEFADGKQQLSGFVPKPTDVAPVSAPLDKAYEMLLDALGFEPASINTLVERTGLQSGPLSSMLLILELEGRVAPHPGGCYCRLS